MHKVFLGIGGNLGNKKENFIKCHKLIENRIGTIVLHSSVYETSPWGFQAENNFWNEVICIETEMDYEELFYEIHGIENEFGRQRKTTGYSSREMDVDILYFDDLYLENNFLIIPHSRLHQRLFVLVPLTEIVPDFKHPLLRQTSRQMLENCKDTSVIKKVDLD